MKFIKYRKTLIYVMYPSVSILTKRKWIFYFDYINNGNTFIRCRVIFQIKISCSSGEEIVFYSAFSVKCSPIKWRRSGGQWHDNGPFQWISFSHFPLFQFNLFSRRSLALKKINRIIWIYNNKNEDMFHNIFLVLKIRLLFVLSF